MSSGPPPRLDLTPHVMDDVSSAADSPEPRKAAPWPWLHPERPLFWLLLALVVYTPFIDTEIGLGNVASDLAAIESVAERGTFFINDSTFFGTIDKFRRDGLYFSQKSPIFHAIGAAPYYVLVRMGYRLSTHPEACLRVLVVFMSILPMGLLLWLIHIHPWVRTHSRRWRMAFTLAFAAGSLLTPFAVTLNHYVFASVALLGAVHLLTRCSVDRRAATQPEALGIGCLVSLSISSDIPPGFLFGLAVAAAWVFRAPTRLPALAAGALPLALLYMGLNMIILDSPLPPNMHEEETMLYEGSFWKEVYDKIEKGEGGYYSRSYIRRVVHSTFGTKGIYWMMPTLVLATAGALRLASARCPGSLLALAFALFPWAIILTAMRWTLDMGGGAYGLRHAFASVGPLYLVLAHPALQPARAVGRGLFAAATIWGVLIAGIGVMKPWSHNTLSAIPPLENIARFCLRHGERLPTGWIGELVGRTSFEPEIGWLDLGLAHLEAGRLEQAETALQHAIAEDPDAPLPYYHLGIAQDMAGRTPSAVRTYARLIELDPKNVGAWNNLGLFYMKLGDPARARAAYEKSLNLQPDNELGRWGLQTIEAWEARARSVLRPAAAPEAAR